MSSSRYRQPAAAGLSGDDRALTAPAAAKALTCVRNWANSSRPLEFNETTWSFEGVREQIEVARVHAEPSGVPDLALEAVDDGLPVFGMILVGAVEQKRLSAVPVPRRVPGRTRRLESAESLSVRVVFVPSNMLSNPNHDKTDRRGDQSPVSVLVVPGIA